MEILRKRKSPNSRSFRPPTTIINALIILNLVVFGNLIGRSDAKPLRFKRAFSYLANETACTVDNIVYREGDAIPTDDPCEQCRCRPPGFSCMLRECTIKPGCRAIRRDGECCPEYQCGCEHNGQIYRDGERIPNAESPCYSCYCQGSSITCALADCKFRFDCEPEYVPGECCPRYDHCPPEYPFTTLKVSSPSTAFSTAVTLTTLLSSTSTTPQPTQSASSESSSTPVASSVSEVTTQSPESFSSSAAPSSSQLPNNVQPTTTPISSEESEATTLPPTELVTSSVINVVQGENTIDVNGQSSTKSSVLQSSKTTLSIVSSSESSLLDTTTEQVSSAEVVTHSALHEEASSESNGQTTMVSVTEAPEIEEVKSGSESNEPVKEVSIQETPQTSATESSMDSDSETTPSLMTTHSPGLEEEEKQTVSPSDEGSPSTEEVKISSEAQDVIQPTTDIPDSEGQTTTAPSPSIKSESVMPENVPTISIDNEDEDAGSFGLVTTSQPSSPSSDAAVSSESEQGEVSIPNLTTVAPEKEAMVTENANEKETVKEEVEEAAVTEEVSNVEYEEKEVVATTQKQSLEGEDQKFSSTSASQHPVVVQSTTLKMELESADPTTLSSISQDGSISEDKEVTTAVPSVSHVEKDAEEEIRVEEVTVNTQPPVEGPPPEESTTIRTDSVQSNGDSMKDLEKHEVVEVITTSVVPNEDTTMATSGSSSSSQPIALPVESESHSTELEAPSSESALESLHVTTQSPSPSFASSDDATKVPIEPSSDSVIEEGDASPVTKLSISDDKVEESTIAAEISGPSTVSSSTNESTLIESNDQMTNQSLAIESGGSQTEESVSAENTSSAQSDIEQGGSDDAKEITVTTVISSVEEREQEPVLVSTTVSPDQQPLTANTQSHGSVENVTSSVLYETTQSPEPETTTAFIE